MLRAYQLTALEQIRASLRTYNRIVCTAATGAGKSILIAELTSFFITRTKGNVLILCHQAEILLQNAQKLAAKKIDVSLYCASLNSKCDKSRVVLASRESASQDKSALLTKQFDLIIVDECHLVSENKQTMYQKIFAACSPRWIVGFTGSPYRLSNGVIFGKGKFWQHEACRITTQELQRLGFLSEHIFPSVQSLIDTSDVKTTASDFNLMQLEKVSSTPLVVQQCVKEWWRVARDRKLTMFFCVSVAHARLVAEEISKYTPEVVVIDGQTPQELRSDIFTRSRSGHLKALVNVGVLTTGIDLPLTDCIVLLRATQSLSLFIQMIGRGLRISPNKANCLLLDFAGNWIRFCGLNNPLVPKLGASKQQGEDYKKLLEMMGITEVKSLIEAPKKSCPHCTSVCPTGLKVCKCGHIFINHATDTHKSSEKYWQDRGYIVGPLSHCELSMKTSRNNRPYVEFFGTIGTHKIITALPINATENWIRRAAKQKYEALLEAQLLNKKLKLAFRREKNGFTNIEIVSE